jgi:hypothetical protein
VRLPSWIGDEDVKILVGRFEKYLNDELKEMMATVDEGGSSYLLKIKGSIKSLRLVSGQSEGATSSNSDSSTETYYDQNWGNVAKQTSKIFD